MISLVIRRNITCDKDDCNEDKIRKRYGFVIANLLHVIGDNKESFVLNHLILHALVTHH